MDGVLLTGIQCEEEALPAFVHSQSSDRWNVPQEFFDGPFFQRPFGSIETFFVS